MELKTLAIDLAALERALSNTLPDSRAFLDAHTGRVVALQGPAAHDPATLRPLAAEPGRHILIEPMPSRVQHAWMLRFIDTVVDPTLRAALADAVDGVGAFREFKRVLRGDLRERERWYRFRSRLLRTHITAWLRLYGIAPVDTALAATLGPLADGDGDGDVSSEHTMRRVAGHYIDHMSESSLRLALGFLRYLKDETAEPAATGLAAPAGAAYGMNAE